METPPLTSVTLGFLFTFYALLVESQPQNEPASPLFFKTLPPLPSPPPPPLAPPPPPFPLRSSPPPPSPRSQSPPPPPRTRRRSLPPSGHVTRRRKPPPPPPPPRPSRRKMNTGKKIGLLFAGIAAILQIGVVGYLVFKRKQLSKVKDRYENCPS